MGERGLLVEDGESCGLVATGDATSQAAFSPVCRRPCRRSWLPDSTRSIPYTSSLSNT